MIFSHDQCLVITTRGPGILYLLSYQNNAKGSDVVGSKTTDQAGVTRFMISFSHHYERFAFMWEGKGEAVYGIGTGLQRLPVGRSWDQASAIPWGSATVNTADVKSIVAGAVDRTNLTTCFIIPDQI